MHDPHSERMSSGETRAASGLALVFAFRMLGMFMVLPVLATYGMDLAGATPALIGLAIGAYGLTQAIFQIPFGIISDRIGRRPVIYLGLMVFALGSVLAANSDSIWGVIAGRILQGRRGDFCGGDGAAVRPDPRTASHQGHGHDRHDHRLVVCRRHGGGALADPRLWLVMACSWPLGHGPVGDRDRHLWCRAPPGTLQHRESGVAKQALLPTLRHPTCCAWI
jgi:hypothetical protein